MADTATNRASDILSNLDFFYLYKLSKPILPDIKDKNGYTNGSTTDIYGKFMPIVLTSSGWNNTGDDNWSNGWELEDKDDSDWNSKDKDDKIKIILPLDGGQSLSDQVSTRIGFHNISTDEYAKGMVEPISKLAGTLGSALGSGFGNSNFGMGMGKAISHLGDVAKKQAEKGLANSLRTVSQMVSMKMAGDDGFFDAMWLDYDPTQINRNISLNFVLPITEKLKETEITSKWCNKVRQYLGALMGLLYPKGIYKPIPRLMKLRLGNIYRGFKGYITSVNYTFSNETVTAGSTQWPLLITGSIGFTSIATYMWDPSGALAINNSNGVLGLTDYNLGKNPAVLFGTFSSIGSEKISDQKAEIDDLNLREASLYGINSNKDVRYYETAEINAILTVAKELKLYTLYDETDALYYTKAGKDAGLIYKEERDKIIDDAIRTGKITEKGVNDIEESKPKEIASGSSYNLYKKLIKEGKITEKGIFDIDESKPKESVEGSSYNLYEKLIKEGKITVVTKENMDDLIAKGVIAPIDEKNRLTQEQVWNEYKKTDEYKRWYYELTEKINSKNEEYNTLLKSLGITTNRTVVDRLGKYLKLDNGEFIDITNVKSSSLSSALNNIFDTVNSVYSKVTEYASAVYNIYRNYEVLSETVSSGINIANVSNLFNNSSMMMNSLSSILGTTSSETSILNDSIYVNFLKSGSLVNISNLFSTSLKSSDTLTSTGINSLYSSTNSLFSAATTSNYTDIAVQSIDSLSEGIDGITSAGSALYSNNMISSSLMSNINNLFTSKISLSSLKTDLSSQNTFLNSQLSVVADVLGV